MCAATSLHSGVMDYSAMHWRFVLTGEETWFDSVILAEEWTDVHVCLGAANTKTCVIIMSLIMVRSFVFDLWVNKCYRTSSHSVFCLCSILTCFFFCCSRWRNTGSDPPPTPSSKKRTKFTPLLANCIFLTLPVWKWENVSRHHSFALFPFRSHPCLSWDMTDPAHKCASCNVRGNKNNHHVGEGYKSTKQLQKYKETKLQGKYSGVSMALKWRHVVYNTHVGYHGGIWGSIE